MEKKTDRYEKPVLEHLDVVGKGISPGACASGSGAGGACATGASAAGGCSTGNSGF